ncbi:MAG: polysaccharide pyruvyl transferase family protein [Blautia sp.]|nr:polysaccharide pyruvyl transferase family protein [Lachnoclostridium sp.]MCM1212194.1 polysaccharide pyruvyl transferase family protein [Blautia sp.]
MIKLVIQGASGLKNSGDEAILQSMLQQLEPEYDITVITFHVAYSERMHPKVKFVAMGSRECRKAVEDCDIFVLGGGGLLQDETSIYNVSRWLRYLTLCIRKGKKTYLYANSIGPVRFGINRILIQRWLKRVTRITLRDELSLQLLKSMGIRENVEVTADPVFSLRREENVDVSRFALPEKYAVICVRHWYDTHPFIPVSLCTKLHIRSRNNRKNYHNYIKNIAWLADYIIRKYHLPVVFLPFLYGRDNHVMEDVSRLMKADSVIVEDEYLKPLEALEIIAGSELLVGMRLHSIIYGAVSEVPTLIISYSMKVKGMAEYMRMGKYVLHVDGLKHSEIAVVLSEIMKNKEQIKQDFQTAAGHLREKEKRNHEILEELSESMQRKNG